jgi:SAM-dependent methyltransferase
MAAAMMTKLPPPAAAAEAAVAAVSHSCACIGSPCLRPCVHGASIGGGFDWGRRFDLVLSFNSFHHFVDPLGAVATAHRLLAPGGVLLLDGVPIDSLELLRVQEKGGGDAESGGGGGGGGGGELRYAGGGGGGGGGVSSIGGGGPPTTCAEDVAAAQELAGCMRAAAGARVSLMVDPTSVSRDWVRRGRVLWLQHKLHPHEAADAAVAAAADAADAAAVGRDSPARFVRYRRRNHEPTVVQRFGFPRACYECDAAAAGGGAHHRDRHRPRTLVHLAAELSDRVTHNSASTAVSDPDAQPQPQPQPQPQQPPPSPPPARPRDEVVLEVVQAWWR